jgi:hypothetical protein
MREIDKWIYQRVFGSDYETISMIGVSDKRELYVQLKHVFDVEMVDYDIRFNEDEDIISKDVVFDDVKLNELIINFACEKMWPIGKMYKGREFILVGDNGRNNGDCNPITSCEQLAEQNELTEVYAQSEFKRWRGKHYVVYGCN